MKKIRLPLQNGLFFFLIRTARLPTKILPSLALKEMPAAKRSGAELVLRYHQLSITPSRTPKELPKLFFLYGDWGKIFLIKRT